jgi:hypothetical protein
MKRQRRKKKERKRKPETREHGVGFSKQGVSVVGIRRFAQHNLCVPTEW